MKFRIILLVTLLCFSAVAFAGIPVWAGYISNLFAVALLFTFLITNTWPKSPLNKAILLYLSWFVVSCFLSSEKAVSRNEFFNLFTGLAVFYTTLAVTSCHHLTSEKPYITGSIIMTISVFVISALGFELVVPHHYFALMVNPNIVAGYMVVLIPVLIGFGMGGKAAHWVKICYFSAAIAGGIILMFTGSRWGWFSLLTSAMVIVAFRARQRKLCFVLWLAGICAIFAFSGSSILNSMGDRLAWWIAALRAFREHAAVGLGPGVFGEAYRTYAHAGVQNTLYAHNYYLQMAAEMGFHGIIFWLVLLLTYVRWFLSQKLTWVNLGMGTGLMALALHNIADYSLALPAHAYLFWFLLAASCPPAKSFDQATRSPQTLPLVRIFLVIACLGLVTAITRPFFAWHKLNSAKAAFANAQLSDAKLAATEAIPFDPLSPEGYALLARIEFELYNKDKLRSHLYRSANYLEEAIERSPYSIELKTYLSAVKKLPRTTYS